MKKTRIALPVLALVLAVSLSAFTKVKQARSGVIWFQVDASGQALDDAAGGVEQDSNPFECDQSGDPCAASLLYPSQTVHNSNGSYGIATGVNINADFQDRDYKPAK